METLTEIHARHSITIHQDTVDNMIPMSLKQEESAASAVEAAQATTKKKITKKKKMIMMINALMITQSETLEVTIATTTTFSLPPADSMTLTNSRPPMLAVHAEVDPPEETTQTTKEEIEDLCCTNQGEHFPCLLTSSLTECLKPKRQDTT